MTRTLRERLRCQNCHDWSDILLVWAAGDCCPVCNSPIERSSDVPARGATRAMPLGLPALSAAALTQRQARLRY